MYMLLYVLLYVIVGLGVAAVTVKRKPYLENEDRIAYLLGWPVAVCIVIATSLWTVFTNGLLSILNWIVRDK